ncbi:hypothetical protein V4842_26575 [Pseudomonas moraviensis]
MSNSSDVAPAVIMKSAMSVLREKVKALPDKDLALMAMVCAQALCDQNWLAEIADCCGLPAKDLTEWSERLIWADNELHDAAFNALGWNHPN